MLDFQSWYLRLWLRRLQHSGKFLMFRRILKILLHPFVQRILNYRKNQQHQIVQKNLRILLSQKIP